jgi:hypothetical protein
MLRGTPLWLLAALSLASGCGGSQQAAPEAAPTHAWAVDDPPSVASVKSCLQRHGLTVHGKPDRQPRPDWDASDHGELFAGGASLYFYSSHGRAARLGGLLEDYVNAANRNHPDDQRTLVHRGSVRVIYEGSADATPIDSCLRQASPWHGR